MDINKPRRAQQPLLRQLRWRTAPIFPPAAKTTDLLTRRVGGFVEEWAYYCLTTKYEHVLRFSGAGDMGIDVAGFVGDERLLGFGTISMQALQQCHQA